MIGDNAAANFWRRSGRMRRLAAALMISWGAFSAPAQASDDLSPSATALVPVDNATLAMMTGGTAVALQLAAAAEAGARAVDLSATSTLQASISRSSARSAGALTTGDISLGGVSGAMGGMTSLQLSTGFNNIQQNSAALAFVF
jgi:hypothetical protein